MMLRKTFFVAAALVCFAYSVFAETRKVRFVYEPRAGETVNSVALAGAFNGWNSSKDTMTRRPDGKFEAVIELKEGLYPYKLVIDGNRWTEDPKADPRLRKEDGFGGFNSAVAVGETGDMYGPPLYGGVVKTALKHDPREDKYFNMINKDSAEIKFRTLAFDASGVALVLENGKRLPMTKVKSYLGFDYYSAFVGNIAGASVKYRFIVSDGRDETIYPADGAFVEASAKIKFPTPDWAKGAVWYQVMADRFRDGDPANNPDGALPWTWNYSEKHPSEKGNFYEFVWGRHFGGDIQGIVKELDYLKELGVTALYLTPVFKADSHHKYNTVDYRHIDDHLGYKGDIAALKGETDDPKTWKWTKTDLLFLDFLKTAKSKGFRVIVDGVFNHCGEHFWAFEDVKKNGKKSRYASWFDITDWDLFMKEADRGKGYAGWAGFGGLPEYKEDATGLVAGPKKHIFDITRRWMDPNGDGDPSDGIDGWRLDVPDNVKMPFWADWSRLVKTINPDAYISGELWDEAPDWLRPELFHAQMNYPFIKTTLNWLSNGWISVSKFDSEIKRLLALYPYQVNLVQQNLFGSHDTDRAVSMLANPGRHFDKGNRLNPADTGDYNPSYKGGKPSKEIYDKLKLASIVQFTLPGAPMLWYGDEAGMWGSDDPFCRETMVWKDLEPYAGKDKVFMPDMFAHYAKLSAIHNTYPELRFGVYESIVADDASGVLVFARSMGGRKVFVALNSSGQPQKASFAVETPDGREFFDAYGEKKFSFFYEDAGGKETASGAKKIKFPSPARVYKVAKSSLSVALPPSSAMILVGR